MEPLKNKNGDTVFIQGLLGRETGRVDEDTLMLLLNLSLMDKQKNPHPGFEDECSQDPLCCIIKDRLERNGGSATLPTIAFLSVICEGVPGKGVMWAYTLYRMFVNDGCRKVTLQEFNMQFPGGELPSAVEFGNAWDAQKGMNNDLECDNILDNYPWEMLVTKPGVECPAG